MTDIAVREELKQYYDNFYDDREGEWRWVGSVDKVQNIIDLCEHLPHDSILEIGAGEGSILQRLSQIPFGKQLYSLEISETGAQAIAKKGIATLVESSIYDGYTIPHEDDVFDLAILSHVIEHVEYPRRLLYEAARVARHVFVEVPLEENFRMPKDFRLRKVGHINFYTYKSFRYLVQSCELNVVDQRITTPCLDTYKYRYGKTGIPKYYFKKLVLKAFPAIATKFLVYHSPLVCKKRAEDIAVKEGPGR